MLLMSSIFLMVYYYFFCFPWISISRFFYSTYCPTHLYPSPFNFRNSFDNVRYFLYLISIFYILSRLFISNIAFFMLLYAIHRLFADFFISIRISAPYVFTGSTYCSYTLLFRNFPSRQISRQIRIACRMQSILDLFALGFCLSLSILTTCPRYLYS
jgi:hypothetical protein